jgi:hypothetical protein
LCTSGRGGDTRKGCRRANVIEILCTHENGKMRPVETITGMVKRG